MSAAPERTVEKSNQPSRTHLRLAFGGSLGAFGALLFVPAGRLDWAVGWLYLVIVITNVTMPPWLNFFPVGNGTALLTGIAPQITDINDYPVVLQVRDQDGLTGPQSFTIKVRHLVYLPLTLNSYPRP